MMNAIILDFIISTFCVIDDELKNLKLGTLRQRGFNPEFSDSEVITLEVLGEFLGMDTDKAIWIYFKTHWSVVQKIQIGVCADICRINAPTSPDRFLD